VCVFRKHKDRVAELCALQRFHTTHNADVKQYCNQAVSKPLTAEIGKLRRQADHADEKDEDSEPLRAQVRTMYGDLSLIKAYEGVVSAAQSHLDKSVKRQVQTVDVICAEIETRLRSEAQFHRAYRLQRLHSYVPVSWIACSFGVLGLHVACCLCRQSVGGRYGEPRSTFACRCTARCIVCR